MMLVIVVVLLLQVAFLTDVEEDVLLVVAEAMIRIVRELARIHLVLRTVIVAQILPVLLLRYAM